jgi:hypothetical protein
MANSFIRHILARNDKLYLYSLWATGQTLLQQSLTNVLEPEFPDKVYGKDWVVMGYKAGNEGVLNVIVTDIRKMYPTDVHNTPLDSLPIYNGVKSLKDFDLLISVGGGKPGVKEWALFAGDRADVPVAGGSAAVSAPLLYPYYPRQLIGLLGGTKGAAEYESELIRHYPQFAHTDTPAIKMMGPQTMAHIVIICFIIIGNVAYFRSKYKMKAEM